MYIDGFKTLDELISMLTQIRNNVGGISGDTKVFIYNGCYDENQEVKNIRIDNNQFTDNETVIVFCDGQ